MKAFEVDKAGLAQLLARKGKAYALLELVQNALDEQVTRVSVELQRGESRGYYSLRVEDDSPEGFADLAHAYTLFAPSKKKGDPELRGRFNLGEKLVIANCRWARITTTTGGVEFDGDTRRRLRTKREVGSVFEGELRMSHGEAAAALEAARTLLVPGKVRLRINGTLLPKREPLRQIKATLPTEIADDEGHLKRTTRATTIEIFEPRRGEMPMLYELGIPVVELDCPWHVNIGQKIPLNMDRDNVTPAYARKVKALVLNEMHDSAPEEALRAPWVAEAMESPEVTVEAVQAAVTARYGEKRVIRDPSDPEGTKLAVSKGYAVIEPGSFNATQWAAIKRSDAARPAGQVTPSPKPYSPDGEPQKYVPREKWTDDQKRIVRLAEELGGRLLGCLVDVQITSDITWPYAAAYGHSKLVLNVGRLGHEWFARSNTSSTVLSLLIHEFGHHFALDHLSEEYHDALCDLGADLARLALNDPEVFRATE